MFGLIKCRITCLVTLGVLTAVLSASCDPVRRHKWLSFFFDGVPPPATKQVQNKQAELQATKPLQESELCYQCHKAIEVAKISGHPAGAIRQCTNCHEPHAGTKKQVWFTHKANNKCTNCHSRRTRSLRSLPVFVAPVPQLCYRCHDDFSSKGPFVHGPVAVGQCLFCHEHHKSKIAGLLKKEEPKLCYQCHDTIEEAQIPGHPAKPMLPCTNCHDPHVGTTRMLLKK